MASTISRRAANARIARTCLAGTLVGVNASSFAAAPTDEKAKSFQLEYVLASSMYGKTPVAEILPEIAKSGASHLDIWPRGHANQREQVDQMGHQRFAGLLKSHNAKLGMTTRYDLGPFKLQKEMEVVKKFGGRLIVCGGRGADGKTLRDKVRAFVKQLKPHLGVAAKLGITLGIENHAGSLINTPDSLRYLAEFAPQNLGVALAPYHLPQDEKLIAKLITDLGNKLVHFYAWEHGMGCHKKLPKPQEMMQMPGRGMLDFRPLLAAMKKISYSGWTEIFMHPVPRGIPILDTTKQVTAAIVESKLYLAKCLKEI